MNAFPLILNVILISLACALGVARSVRLLKRYPRLGLADVHRKAGHLFIIVVAAVVIAPLLFYVDSRHMPFFTKVPLWLGARAHALAWGVINAVVSYLLAMALTISRREGRRQFLSLLFAGVAIIGSFQFVEYQFIRPIDGELADRQTQEGYFMQSTGVSCSAAAGATVAHILGLETSEKELARIAGTGPLGTSPASLVMALKGLGVECERVYIEDADVGLLRPPAVLFVDHPAAGFQSHSIALLGLSDGIADIWDPLGAIRKTDTEELRGIWHGRALQCRRARQ